jgi:hypothetical protein
MRHDRQSSCSYWVKQLLQPEAFFGVGALAVQPFLLGIRATLLGHMLAQAIPDRPLGTLTTLGMHYEVGTCSVIGLALTMAEMISVSVFIHDSSVSARRRFLRILSGIGLLLLSALELAGADGQSGKLTAILLTMALVVFDSLCGILIIDCLAIPGVLTMGWAIHDVIRRDVIRDARTRPHSIIQTANESD